MSVAYVLLGVCVGLATVALAAGIMPVSVTGAVALFLIAGNLAVILLALHRIRAHPPGATRGPWTRPE